MHSNQRAPLSGRLLTVRILNRDVPVIGFTIFVALFWFFLSLFAVAAVAWVLLALVVKLFNAPGRLFVRKKAGL